MMTALAVKVRRREPRARALEAGSLACLLHGAFQVVWLVDCFD